MTIGRHIPLIHSLIFLRIDDNVSGETYFKEKFYTEENKEKNSNCHVTYVKVNLTALTT